MFNIASGARISLNALLAQMRAATGVTLPANYQAARVGDIVHSGADIHHAQALLGFAPQVNISEGIRRAAAYYAVPH